MAVPDEREVKVVPKCFLCSILTEAALEEQLLERRRYFHVAQSRNMERSGADPLSSLQIEPLPLRLGSFPLASPLRCA
jgi:hypothetical protein